MDKDPAIVEYTVILFDGVCNLCNGFVNFVIDRDRKGVFKFASLQSQLAENLLKDVPKADRLKSIVVIKKEKIFTKSRGALEILKNLSFPSNLLYVFILVPWFIRDWFYDRIARNRYRWFGRTDECRIPTEDIKERFLA